MKYVVFKHNTHNHYLPVLLPEAGTHADVRMADHTAVSAGFVEIEPVGGGLVTIGEQVSTSLKLGPHKRDKRLIENLLIDRATHAFYDYPDEPEPERTRVQKRATNPRE